MGDRTDIHTTQQILRPLSLDFGLSTVTPLINTCSCHNMREQDVELGADGTKDRLSIC
jgi:hypothetical protein